MCAKSAKSRTTSRSKKFVALGAAVMTASALTGAALPERTADYGRAELVRLLADFRPFGTDPAAIPDLTNGLGAAGSAASQQALDRLARLIVANVDLGGLAQATGVDPNGLVGNTTNDLLSHALGAALGGVTLNGDDLVPALVPAISQLGWLSNYAPPVAGAVGATIAGGSLGGLLGNVGVNLDDPLNSSADPGVNVVTTGALFALLKVLGGENGWVPASPDSIAQEVNGTGYDTVDWTGDQLSSVLWILYYVPSVSHYILTDITDTLNTVDLAQVRLTPVIGVGLGALAAGGAYQQVAADLKNQPGGAAYTGTDSSLLGSFTVMPMVLLLNPGRANGGVLARAYPIFRLLGIDTVTPETEVSSSGGQPVELLGHDTGLAIGGANLIPVKFDVGIQNNPISDFAAWPNPVTLANNAAALMFPTYVLRGADLANIDDEFASQISQQTPGTLPTDDRGLALNFYLTVPVAGAPVLEPTYLAVDAINLLTGANLNNPIGTALNPFLTSAGNLGYTDTVRTADGQYVRTFDDTGVPTAFFSFPDLDWSKVPGDLANSLRVGVEQALSDGLVNPGPAHVNALKELLDSLNGGNPTSAGTSGLTDALVDNALDSIVSSPSTDSSPTVPLSSQTAGAATQPTEAKHPLREALTELSQSVTPRPKATAGITGSDHQAPIKKAVKKAVNDVSDGVKKAVNAVKKAVKSVTKKVSDAAKPKPKANAAG